MYSQQLKYDTTNNKVETCIVKYYYLRERYKVINHHFIF